MEPIVGLLAAVAAIILLLLQIVDEHMILKIVLALVVDGIDDLYAYLRNRLKSSYKRLKGAAFAPILIGHSKKPG